MKNLNKKEEQLLKNILNSYIEMMSDDEEGPEEKKKELALARNLINKPVETTNEQPLECPENDSTKCNYPNCGCK